MKKVKFLIFLLAIIIAGSYIYTNAKFVSDNERVVASIKVGNVLRDKYGTTFKSSENGYRTITANENRYYFTNQKVKGKMILAEISKKENDNIEVVDNYVALLYEEKTNKKIQSIAESVFEQTKIYYQATSLPLSKNIDSSTTFKQYLKNNDNTIEAYIITPYVENWEDKTNELISAFRKNEINIEIHLFFISDYEEKIKNTNFEELLLFDGWYDEKVNFLMGSDLNTRYVTYFEGDKVS